MIRPSLLLLALLSGVLLAGCGTPDEQESDESPRSEQESVGEGEVPGLAPVAVTVAVGVAALLLRRR